jgi:hypothetical protein
MLAVTTTVSFDEWQEGANKTDNPIGAALITRLAAKKSNKNKQPGHRYSQAAVCCSGYAEQNTELKCWTGARCE